MRSRPSVTSSLNGRACELRRLPTLLWLNHHITRKEPSQLLNPLNGQSPTCKTCNDERDGASHWQPQPMPQQRAFKRLRVDVSHLSEAVGESAKSIARNASGVTAPRSSHNNTAMGHEALFQQPVALSHTCVLQGPRHFAQHRGKISAATSYFDAKRSNGSEPRVTPLSRAHLRNP